MTTDAATKILVADDDLEILALVARHLSSLPAQIVEASDGEEALRLARREKPKLIVAGASAYSRHIDWARFRKVADEIGAFFMVDMAHYAGLVAAGVYPSPLPHAHVVTTTTHKTLRGPRGGMVLSTDAEIGKKINSAVFPGLQGGPLMHIIAGKAVAFGEALRPDFKVYAQNVVDNARALAAALTERGLKIVSGGTDSHVMLVDLRPKKATGVSAEKVLDRAGITVNKNLIPFDQRPPLDPSGIRIGTPAITSRGVNTSEIPQIVRLIDRVLMNANDDAILAEVKKEVNDMMSGKPLFAW